MAESTLDLQARLDIAQETIRRLEERSLTGQFALEFMHEIRNPLEALGNLIYVMTNDPETSSLPKFLELAEEQVDTLRDIAGRTLDLTRHTHTAQPRDLVSLADAALRIHQRKMEDKKIRLVRDLPAVRGMAAVYSGEILGVLSNLIANAIDALPANGTVHLRLHRSAGSIHFIVADNGHGIATKHAHEIFEPFFTTKGTHGTGLGLAIARRIVERHRGTLSMRSSVRPGNSGTVFKISLPAQGTMRADT